MDGKRTRNGWLVAAAVGLALSQGALASGSTTTWQDALEASPNRLSAEEAAQLERRAASGENAKEAPEGVYSPSAAGTMSTYGGSVTTPGTTGATAAGSATGATSAAGTAGGDTTGTPARGTAGSTSPATDPSTSGTTGRSGTTGAGAERRATPGVPATPAQPGVSPASPATSARS